MKVLNVAIFAFACVAAISARVLGEEPNQINFDDEKESDDTLGEISLPRILCLKSEIMDIQSDDHEIPKWFEKSRVLLINVIQSYRVCNGENACLEKATRKANNQWNAHIKVLQATPHGGAALRRVRDALERCRESNP